MIIYRQQEYAIDPAIALREVCAAIDALQTQTHVSPDALLAVFVDLSEIASAVADHTARDADGPDMVADTLRDAVSCAADALLMSWCEQPLCTARALAEAQMGIRTVIDWKLPNRVSRRVSEGFAYYALDPQLYAEAALQWAGECRPSQVWCVGLRTIGLSLAAVAAAALRTEGIDARVRTLRPRGHPFDRHVRLDPRLARELTESSSAWYLVIDEGPDISGSSMAGAASALMRLGIHASRIILMPGHRPDIDAMASASVQAPWRRHEIRAADFDRAWIASGRLANDWGADCIEDLGAGCWRHHRALHAVPAVHPHHERRKYRLHRHNGDALLKFAGYGSYGARHLRRAAESAAAGWSLPPRAFFNGWMETAWWWQTVSGSEPEHAVSQLAGYLAFVRESWSSDVAAEPAALLEMTTVNLCEMGFQREARQCERLMPRGAAAAVHVDARMRPHEWLQSSRRYIKSDGVEHHDDHFFPGPTDIAWDLAGAVDEWGLEPAAADALIGRYIALTADRDVTERLPFYRIAYLAFRGGYTASSGAQLHGSADGHRFAREHQWYRHRLAMLLQGEACHSRAS